MAHWYIALSVKNDPLVQCFVSKAWPIGTVLVSKAWPIGTVLVSKAWPIGTVLVSKAWPIGTVLVSKAWPIGSVLGSKAWPIGTVIVWSKIYPISDICMWVAKVWSQVVQIYRILLNIVSCTELEHNPYIRNYKQLILISETLIS